MKKIIFPYKHNAIILRLLQFDDLNQTLLWRNTPNHYTWFKTPKILSQQEHIHWFIEYVNNSDDYVFIITNETENFGQLSIYNINWNNKTGEFGRFLVNPIYENKGIMKKACQVSLKLAREVLLLDRLSLEVRSDNKKAIHIYQSCGFKVRTLIDGCYLMDIQL